jgi:Lrp/AsnC family transcriptional regulator for asnA, asnC and gidA
MRPDDLDKAILKELESDARQSFRELAKKTHVSVVTVAQRVRRLERDGVIRGYFASVDRQKLGYDITTITEVTVSKGKLIEVQEKIAKMRSVCAVYDVTGIEDSIVISKFKTRDEVSSFAKELLTILHVERTNTHMVLNTYKEDFRYPMIQEHADA